jgi:hypothetical protein
MDCHVAALLAMTLVTALLPHWREKVARAA